MSIRCYSVIHCTTRAVLVALVLWTAGCKSFSLFDKSAKLLESKNPRPDRAVAIWKDTVYYHAGKPPTRGFGGRVYFYNDQGQAIPAEGQLVVYAYDDTDRQGTTGVPSGLPASKAADRKYAFTADQFKQHRSDSDLGPSYSIWIPWDQLGGPRRTISLLPVFRTSEGQVVMGQQSTLLLPGPAAEQKPPAEGFAKSPYGQSPQHNSSVGEKDGVQRASYQRDTQPSAEPSSTARLTGPSTAIEPRLETVTIDVPQITDRRLRQPIESYSHRKKEQAELTQRYLQALLARRQLAPSPPRPTQPTPTAPQHARGFAPLAPPPVRPQDVPEAQTLQQRYPHMRAPNLQPDLKGASVAHSTDQSSMSHLPMRQPPMHQPPMNAPMTSPPSGAADQLNGWGAANARH